MMLPEVDLGGRNLADAWAECFLHAFSQKSLAHLRAVLWALLRTTLRAASVFSEGCLLYSRSAVHFAVMAGSISLIPASNQSSFFLALLPKVSKATSYMALWMWFHRAVAQSVWAVLQSHFDDFREAFAQVRHQSSGGVDPRAALLFGAVYSSGSETHLAAGQGVVSITVGAVVGASDKHLVKEASPDDHEVQLVPVLGHGVPPGDSVVWLGREECVGDAEIMVGAELE